MANDIQNWTADRVLISFYYFFDSYYVMVLINTMIFNRLLLFYGMTLISKEKVLWERR